jgi:DNA-binding IclR family transcriptional regulator
MEAAIGYERAQPARTAPPGTGRAPAARGASRAGADAPAARAASRAGGDAPAARAASPGISAVLDVLDVLDCQGPATLAQLARETGIAKSTLHRVCSMMSERGWVARDARSGYIELGPRVAWLARATPLSPLTAGFHGVARTLVALHNETTCLTVLDGRDSVFIAKEETTHAVRLVTAVGSRLPAFAAASGRVMLADRPEEEVAALYAGHELVTPTGRRLADLDALTRILRDARRRGYAENIDETSLGLHCIAAPVGPPGRVVAAITLCVPSGRMSAARRREMLPDLLRAAREIVARGPGTADLGAPATADLRAPATADLRHSETATVDLGAPETATADVRGPETATADLRGPEASTADLGSPETSTADLRETADPPATPLQLTQSIKLTTFGASTPQHGARRRTDPNRKVAP